MENEMILTFTVESDQFPTKTITVDYTGYSIEQLQAKVEKLKDSARECYRIRRDFAFYKGIQFDAEIKAVNALIHKLQAKMKA